MKAGTSKHTISMKLAPGSAELMSIFCGVVWMKRFAMERFAMERFAMERIGGERAQWAGPCVVVMGLFTATAK